ncbi:hypothetical protein [Pelagicoccus sp. SDUM812002]|uniref:hypothetical protein n=1 Tax=Pelagicoccus sp. SDUM812002 TaxID=3041266 RepID=UPI00280D6A53|nr:hypothetical protein [Pelagicoccus sp. SDUM812002]MDQ8186362.1 hypothetical protein [Pelagicoccus sp. SDUM812002]
MSKQTFSIESVVYLDGAQDKAAEARSRYKEFYPGRSARRMTHLGMMIGACIQKLGAEKSVPVLYASAFGESESLERFIDSFPQASPALFQSSIHPSAVEQALIPSKQAVDRFYPITSERFLFAKALENCFLLEEEEVVLLGGEERGDWLVPVELASGESFAFGLRLRRGGDGLGTISLESDVSLEGAVDTPFSELARALEERRQIRVPSFALDAWIRIDWK